MMNCWSLGVRCWRWYLCCWYKILRSQQQINCLTQTIGASIKHLQTFEAEIVAMKVKSSDLFSCFGLRLVKCWHYLMPMLIFLRSEPLVTFNTKPKHTLIYWYRLHYNTSLSSFGFIKNFQQSQANKNSTQIPGFVLWTIFVY